MGALVTNNTRIFNANQFLNAFQQSSVAPWISGATYAIGDVVYNLSRKYVSSSAGTAGGTPPTHTSGESSDGSVNWIFVENFKDTNYFENNIFLAIGKKTPWYDFAGVQPWADSTLYLVGDLTHIGADNYECLIEHTGDGAGNNSPDVDTTNWRLVTEETPKIAENDFYNTYTLLNDIIAAKKVQSTDVSMAVRRVNWASGTTYSMFHPDQDDFAYANEFYVYNSEGNIYKCIDNNNGVASTSEPTGTIDYQTTVDGYTWRYMASVPVNDASTSYIPVEYKTDNDLSTQWTAQSNAKQFEISAIVVTDPGSWSVAPSVVITPTGGDTPTIPATAVVVLNGTDIDYIQITNHGSGYKNIPDITFSGGTGSGGAATAVLSPKDGNGANILTELDARYAMVDVSLSDDEAGYFPIDSDDNVFRQITLVIDPQDQATDLPATAISYMGPGNEDFDGSSTVRREFKEATGRLLYIENIGPITRASGQTEDIKIVLKF